MGSFASPVVHKVPLGGGWRGPGLGSVTVLTLFSGRHLMHVRRALALTVVVPLLLAGCSDDEPTPKMPDPPPSSSSTPSPSETETAEAESAEEFIRRWVGGGRRDADTGETAEYRTLSEGCRACEDSPTVWSSTTRRAATSKWDGWTDSRIRSRREWSETFRSSRLGANRRSSKAGGKAKTLPGGPGQHRNHARAERRVRGIVLEKSEVESDVGRTPGAYCWHTCARCWSLGCGPPGLRGSCGVAADCARWSTQTATIRLPMSMLRSAEYQHSAQATATSGSSTIAVRQRRHLLRARRSATRTASTGLRPRRSTWTARTWAACLRPSEARSDDPPTIAQLILREFKRLTLASRPTWWSSRPAARPSSTSRPTSTRWTRSRHAAR